MIVTETLRTKETHKWRPQFKSCIISQLWTGQKKTFTPRPYVPTSICGIETIVYKKPTFELLPFFTHIPTPPTVLNPMICKENLKVKSASAPVPPTSPKPIISPKPVSRKICIKINRMRHTTILAHVKEEGNQEYSSVKNVERVDSLTNDSNGSLDVPTSNQDQFLEESRNQTASCDLIKLRKASMKIIQEISVEKNSEKLRVLKIMKDDLKERLCRKVKILKEERDELDNDDVENEKEALRIVAAVSKVGTLSEVDKLEIHMRESGSITNLLLFLTSKLESTDALLHNYPDPGEKERLENKKKKLSSQMSEAINLKEFRERKGLIIEEMLDNYLDIGDFIAYTDYMDTKFKLIKERREVEDKIQLGDQMVQALRKLNFH